MTWFAVMIPLGSVTTQSLRPRGCHGRLVRPCRAVGHWIDVSNKPADGVRRVPLLARPAVLTCDDWHVDSIRKTVQHNDEPGHCHELTLSCDRRMPLLINDRRRTLLCESIQWATSRVGPAVQDAGVLWPCFRFDVRHTAGATSLNEGSDWLAVAQHWNRPAGLIVEICLRSDSEHVKHCGHEILRCHQT